MLIYVAISCVVVVLLLFIINPMWGIMLAFVVRPLIDTTWSEQLIFGLKLTEIFSVLVPVLVLTHLFFTHRGRTAFQTMPCKTIWTIYALNIIFFSAIILYNEGVLFSLNTFFRHINGFIAFYMVQAFFNDKKKTKYFLIALITAGLFPMGVGLYQFLTGVQWVVTVSEGIVRNIGLYHDAITVRYYAMQTILALLLYSSLYVKNEVKNKILFVVYGLISIAVMFKAYSKSGMAALVLWGFTWNVLQKKYRMLILTGFVLIIFFGFYGNDIFDQINTVFNKEISAINGSGDVQRTFNGRWYIWQQEINKWTKYGLINKIFGSGHVSTQVHNDYLMFLFHGGVLGLLVYLSLLITIGNKITRNLFEKVDVLSMGALMVFIMWCIDTVGLVPSAYSGYQWFVWGTIGLALKMRNQEKEDDESKINRKKDNFSNEKRYIKKKTLLSRLHDTDVM